MLGQRLERLRRSGFEGTAAGRGGPPGGIRDHPSNVRVEICRVRLVTGRKIEDPAAAALVAAAAPEHLAALKPTDQDEPIGRRHVEGLAVHLLVLEEER